MFRKYFDYVFLLGLLLITLHRHLGFCREEFMPHRRGFDSFDGYVNGAEHYFTHIRDPDRVSFDNFSSGFDFYSAVAQSPVGTRSINWVRLCFSSIQRDIHLSYKTLWLWDRVGSKCLCPIPERRSKLWCGILLMTARFDLPSLIILCGMCNCRKLLLCTLPGRQG